MLITQLLELENEIKNGEWAIDHRKGLWGGADVVVRSKRTRNIIEGEAEGRYVFVISTYAKEISALIYRLKEIFRDYLDFSSKYIFYPRLGERARKYLDKRDDLGVLLEMVDEAKRMAQMLEGRLYFAYGSNIDENQMSDRCPTAKMIGKVRLDGYKFIINNRGVASMIEKSTSFVEGILWALLPDDEIALDRYEGVSYNLYYKSEVVVSHSENGNEVPALVYIASETNYGEPRIGYLEKIIEAAERLEFRIKRSESSVFQWGDE